MDRKERYELFNNAIDKLRKCFGGINVIIKKDSIFIVTPWNSSYKNTKKFDRSFSISIEIEGKEILLSDDYATDILLYGNVVSEEFVRPFISEEKMKLYERSLKINKLIYVKKL